MRALVAKLWKSLRGPLQWRLLYFTQAKFMVGVVGVIRDDDGRVLLLKHRFWPEGRQWGLPTGYAKRGETFEDTVVREVMEETGLKAQVNRLVRVESGFRLRAEVAYEGELLGGVLALNPTEILEAGWFPAAGLPEETMPGHRQLVAATTDQGR